MEEPTSKYHLTIKIREPRFLDSIVTIFCRDSGMSFNEAKSNLTTTGAILKFTSKVRADNAAEKYRKLGCSVEEEQDTKEHLRIPKNKQPSDEESTGFANIGKRLEKLELNDNSEHVKKWKQAAEEPQQNETTTRKEDPPQETYIPKVEKSTGSALNFPSAKVVWFIIGLIVVILFFLGNSNKKKGNYESNYSETSYQSNNNPANYQSSDNSPTRHHESQTSDDDWVIVGQYRCTRYHYNKAEELSPSNYEKQAIENDQRALSSLKIEVESDYVDNFSESSVNRHNSLVNEYNERLQNVKWRINSYNDKVSSHNNYLINNCRKAF